MTLNFRGRLIATDKPIVMGILNLTNDSFYEGSRVSDPALLVTQAKKMIEEGASILDVGAMSSRPGARITDEQDEIRKIVEAVGILIKQIPDAVISVDTLRSSVAKAGLDAGASMVNDISAGEYDPHMMPTVAAYNVPYVMMHMKGLPENMQSDPQYKDVVLEIMSYFSRRIDTALQHGIRDVVLDPGFGFGKTISHNFEILKSFEAFRIWDKPLLAGISRKSMIWKTLGTDAGHALNGTTALHMTALAKGASILRVHDVREAVECIKLFEFLK